MCVLVCIKQKKLFSFNNTFIQKKRKKKKNKVVGMVGKTAFLKENFQWKVYFKLIIIKII